MHNHSLADSCQGVESDAHERLVPILTAAMVENVALIPLGGAKTGGKTQTPTVTVTLRGLTSSTLPDTLIVPMPYLWYGRITAGV